MSAPGFVVTAADATVRDAGSRAAGTRRRRRVELREAVLLGATVVVALLVGSVDHGFLQEQNLRFMMLNSVVLSLVAIGQTLVIATRGVDLSVAPVLGLSAIVTGLLGEHGAIGLWGAVPIAAGIGLGLGLLNGLLVARLAIPPIITTLGTYSLYGGLVFLYSDGTQVDSVPASFAALGNGALPLLPVPNAVAVLIVVAAASWFLLNHTRFGRAVLAVGNNDAAAFAAGIPVAWVKLRVYALSGLLAALSGLMFVCYTGSATVTTGTGDHMELQSIAVALIGGTAISGGRGSVVGTVLGSLFLGVVLTALVFLHVPPIWYSAGEGLMILVAVSAGRRRRGGA
ncbi:MAG: ABC transporter permease [Gluconacetobacter diazotrophicus]|nr:ABC transporter permease [Gluconacetobacter diazotrophicus]